MAFGVAATMACRKAASQGKPGSSCNVRIMALEVMTIPDDYVGRGYKRPEQRKVLADQRGRC